MSREILLEIDIMPERLVDFLAEACDEKRQISATTKIISDVAPGQPIPAESLTVELLEPRETLPWKARLARLEGEVSGMKFELGRQAEEITVLTDGMIEGLFPLFVNHVVQLGYMVHAAVMLRWDPKSLDWYGWQFMKFPSVQDSRQRDALALTPGFASVSVATGKEFQDLAVFRNDTLHPALADVKAIDRVKLLLLKGIASRPAMRAKFDPVVKIYRGIIFMPEFDELVEEYNAARTKYPFK